MTCTTKSNEEAVFGESFLKKCGHWFHTLSKTAMNPGGFQEAICTCFLCHFFQLSIVIKEKAMATHSSTLAWQIPWIEELGRLQSMESLGVWHDWMTSLSIFTFMHWRRKWQPTPVFLPGESQGRIAWWAAIYGVAQCWTRLKRLSNSSSNIL